MIQKVFNRYRKEISAGIKRPMMIFKKELMIYMAEDSILFLENQEKI